MRRSPFALIATIACALLLSACGNAPRVFSPLGGTAPQARPHDKAEHELPSMPAAGSGRGGYYQDDGPGDNPPPNLMEVPDAVVTAEPYARAANRPYAVFGKTYTPLVNDEPFEQRGIASWYGKKFHGQRTSSGELYDMYKMTAAHPTLPIPSYARVTSVASGKQVVVRINDRGPFHSSRIVDVSFTAALKLGLLGKGSHEVTVERVLPGQGESLSAARRNAPAAENAPVLGGFAIEMPTAASISTVPELTPTPPPPPAVAGTFYLQLGAFSRQDKANQLRSALVASGALIGAVEVVEGGTLHRVFSGPFETRLLAAQAAAELPAGMNLKPIVVRR